RPRRASGSHQQDDPGDGGKQRTRKDTGTGVAGVRRLQCSLGGGKLALQLWVNGDRLPQRPSRALEDRFDDMVRVAAMVQQRVVVDPCVAREGGPELFDELRVKA